MRVRVEIKAEQIEGAQPGATNCVLARALADLVGPSVLVVDDCWTIDKLPHYMPLSRSACDIVRRFDKGAVIKPCAIFMDIPEEVLHAHHG